jgi:hypothetical protein
MYAILLGLIFYYIVRAQFAQQGAIALQPLLRLWHVQVALTA